MSVANSKFVNIAAYKFVGLDNLPERRKQLRQLCQNLELKGTILLSHEGINLFLAGSPESIQSFLAYLRGQNEFADLEAKESPSDYQPFSRMLVRLKKEIISMGVDGIDPVNRPSPKLPPQELAKWLREGKKVHLLDTRNDYEVEMGTFENAVALGIDSFRQFPDAIKKLPESWKHEPIVMFCTGGIRCEKAGPLMEREGFQQIYQLEGGILKYFEECQGQNYQGDCFVFDKRVAVNPRLAETEDTLCYACQHVLTPEEQQHPHYQPPKSCPHCFESDAEKLRRHLAARNAELRSLTTPLPGSKPYENVRPINVAQRFDGLTVRDVLASLLIYAPENYWESECKHGMIRYQGTPLDADSIVRAGWRIEHIVPFTVEPSVNADIQILDEDAALVVVNKPAPLPMHPCGRFNRNSLIYILDQLFYPNRLRMLHRLDANTTGILVLAKTKEYSRQMHPQFANGSVSKKYLALVHGRPTTEHFRCETPISRVAGRAGGRYTDAEQGLPCVTEFRTLASNDQYSLIECRPLTGRTNQIRIHLTSLSLPIVGDPVYHFPQDCLQPSDGEGDGVDPPLQTLDLDAPPLCLHSWEIGFQHPLTKEERTYLAPAPSWALPFMDGL